MFFGLFKRTDKGGEESSDLPADVMAALESATFHVRNGGGDKGDEPRLVVQVEGFRGFIMNRETCANWVKKAFGLNDAQAKRGANFLANRARQHHRAVMQAVQPASKSWISDY